jgi:hypothetical protein
MGACEAGEVNDKGVVVIDCTERRGDVGGDEGAGGGGEPDDVVIDIVQGECGGSDAGFEGFDGRV